ncbi:MAG: CBS domain-containing protein [Thermoplasmata archaeon]|nr:CBS domain-containing protein [Thermoplasmata archaeon]MCI4359821.1 CBS domain-containing protein [Thermoplasmata archaeon]
MSNPWPTARELMTPKPITLSTDAPLSRALGLMRTNGIHEIPILRNGRLTGMITFDSIARHTNLALSMKVEHLMVLPPVITPSAEYPELAEQLLSVGLRAAPVVGKRGELVGVVSRTDLVRVLPNLPALAQHRVEEIANPVNLILSENDPCSQLFNQVRLLEEHPLPVADRAGHLVGAVGLADLGQVLWKPLLPGKRDRRGPGRIGDITIGTVMHTPALTVEAGSSSGAAALAMSRAKVSSAFLVERGVPVGIVSQASLLGLAVGLAESLTPTKLSDVYVQIHGLRGSGDPETLSEIDQLVAKGLRRIAHHARPTLLSLDVSPHSARAGDATVHVRVQTDEGIYYATVTDWSFFASVTSALDDIEGQARRAHETKERRHRRAPGRKASLTEDSPVTEEVEAKIRAATGDRDEDE